MQQLGPSGVVIEVAGDQRNIDVAALADRLAVIHGLEHGQAAGMLLHGPRQRVQISSSRVRCQGLPFRQGGACGAHRSVNVRCRSLGNRGKLLAGRGISGFEVSAVRRLPPRTVDKMSEAAAMSIQPGERLFRVLRRGTVFHGDELFSDAHIAWCASNTNSNSNTIKVKSVGQECPTHTFFLR